MNKEKIKNFLDISEHVIMALSVIVWIVIAGGLTLLFIEGLKKTKLIGWSLKWKWKLFRYKITKIF